MIEIATCSYGEFKPEMGMPVRTSVGFPKWFSHPSVAWENTYPRYSWLHLPYDEYHAKYISKMNSIGADTLRQDLVFMAETYEKLTHAAPERAVLLCFEKLSKAGAWCHRTILATYLEEHLGCTIVELGAKPVPLPDPEPTLW